MVETGGNQEMCGSVKGADIENNILIQKVYPEIMLVQCQKMLLEPMNASVSS